MFRCSGVPRIWAVALLALALALAPALATGAPAPPWLQFYDVTDVSVTWSLTQTAHVCLTGEPCFDLPDGSETDTFTAAWPSTNAHEMPFNTIGTPASHRSRCTDRAGGVTTRAQVGGTLRLTEVARVARSTFIAGFRCFDPTLEVGSDLPAPGLRAQIVNVGYSGSQHLESHPDAVTTTMTDLAWNVSARYATRCSGVAVQQTTTLPVSFAAAWGVAPFCLWFTGRGLPARTAGSCERLAVRLGTYSCGVGPGLTARRVRVCDLLPPAQQKRLIGGTRRHTDRPQGFCGFFSPRGNLFVYRSSNPSWPYVYTRELAYAKLLVGIGRATFTTFSTPGGGTGLVVRGSKPWITWAIGQRHGDVIWIPGAIRTNAVATLRTILGNL